MQDKNLLDLGLIAIRGIDAAKFLQGQLTCDVREITQEKSLLGAHCDPKGRVQFTFRIGKYQENYYLLLPHNMVSSALSLLQKYAVFSKVTLADESALWQHGNDPLAEQLKQSFTKTTQFDDTNNWLLHDIFAGIPTIIPETSGEFTPHDINLPQLGGVSFNKGCYTGQEIVARMQFLGKLKQRLYRIRLQAETLPAPNTKLFVAENSEQREIGSIVNTAFDSAQNCYLALAILREDSLKQQIHLQNLDDVIIVLH